jgi:hypothetical protein
MHPIVIGLIVFAFTLGGAIGGHSLRAILPSHHLDDESKDTIKLGIGLIATMTALVLGLVTASAKSSFDAIDTAVKHSAMDVVALDRLLARYGPETEPLRAALERALVGRIQAIWPEHAAGLKGPPHSVVSNEGEHLADGIRALVPRDDRQRALQARAAELGEEILQTRWLVFAGGGTSVPVPFLVVLLFWLTITFASFGLFAPRNPTVLCVLFVCAVSVGSAVLLILEMDGPFSGVLKVSARPLQYALANLNQ